MWKSARRGQSGDASFWAVWDVKMGRTSGACETLRAVDRFSRGRFSQWSDSRERTRGLGVDEEEEKSKGTSARCVCSCLNFLAFLLRPLRQQHSAGAALPFASSKREGLGFVSSHHTTNSLPLRQKMLFPSALLLVLLELSSVAATPTEFPSINPTLPKGALVSKDISDSSIVSFQPQPRARPVTARWESFHEPSRFLPKHKRRVKAGTSIIAFCRDEC